MMALPIALQLYTLREALEKDYVGTIQKVADLGYAGVETAGNYGGSPATAAKLFADLGLTVTSGHAPLPVGDKKNEVLDALGTLGTKRIVCPWLPPERWASSDSIKAVCDELNAADEAARAEGFTLLYHNHWFEYELVNGTPAYKIMLEHIAPTVQFEIDTYWVKVGGQDPVAVVKEFGSRAPLLHIKDGPAENREQPMTAVGEGTLDWDAIIGAGQGAAEWLIVELDRCATDMLEAVAKSKEYLVGKGLARGR
jgi:sugar phosphate isomerase/epimerase